MKLEQCAIHTESQEYYFHFVPRHTNVRQALVLHLKGSVANTPPLATIPDATLPIINYNLVTIASLKEYCLFVVMHKLVFFA